MLFSIKFWHNELLRKIYVTFMSLYQITKSNYGKFDLLANWRLQPTLSSLVKLD